ncbi:GNAT family N-acetyltransferase [Lentzea tibetensis]|uniref:GNAT family N-acetyltransferase n=2 Tax=Lentzea tibetensis TaxID=2591470 RepID=A0A563ETC8_9PSEU|nr:GNAT family N-acetyltransferase [Lentzea tibetensis]
MTSMEIRTLDGDDQATVRALFPGFAETMRVALPDDPPASEDLMARLLQKRRGTDRVVLAVYDGAEPAGYVKLGLDLSATLDTGHGSLWVFPGFRRRGAGRLLVDAAREELAARGRTRLLVDAPHTAEADAFAESAGGKRIVVNVRNRLKLKGAAIAAEAVAGYRFVRWNDGCPDDLVDSYAKAWSELDVPINGQARVGQATAADVREREAEAERARHRCYVTAAVDEATGEIAGYCTMFVRDSPMADAGEVLVLPAHRRKGLAAQLKAELLSWVAGTEPQVLLVQAWNDETNSAVLALNRKLGFSSTGGWATYEVSA